MRKPVMMVLLGWFAVIHLFSQSNEDSVIYNKGLSILNSATTPEVFLESAAYFESLTIEFPDQWLSYYYSGLSYIRAGQQYTDKKSRDQMLDSAQPLIDKAFSLKQGEPELHVLQAFLYQMRLMIDPPSRALNLSQKADASLKRAVEADPANPRAYFLMANIIYHTPPLFNGGPKNALPVFLKAREKYKTYRAELSFLPDWGKKQNEEMIRLCNTEKK